MKFSSGLTLALFLFTGVANADTLTVGAGKTYRSPCAAIAAAKAGDTIAVDAGRYDGDHCSWSTDNLTLRGVNGRAVIDAGKDPGNVAARKGILVTDAPRFTLESFELAGAAVGGNDKNAAGLRHQGKDLVVRDCSFHDNENGILGSPTASGKDAPGTGSVLIENSEFSANGYGDGQSHNIYLGKYLTFTMKGSYSHDAVVGHLLKSRALTNIVASNRFDDGTSDAVSYEVSFPDAGRAYVVGNVIVQSNAGGNNSVIIDYGSEPQKNPDLPLFVVNNTIVNNRTNGATFVKNYTATPSVIQNDIFVGAGTISSPDNAVTTTNYQGDAPGFVAAGSDWHLAAGSPCIDKGTDATSLGANAITTSEYVAPLGTTPRSSLGTIDIGAYEYGNPGLVLAPDADGGGGTGGSSGATGPGIDGGASGGPAAMNDSADDGGCNTGARSSSAAAGLALVGVLLLARRRR